MNARHRPDLPRLPLPDPLLARRALGDMRDAMRQGFGLVRDGVERAPLPAPVAAITGSVLRRVDDLAHTADAVARTVVDGFLGPDERTEGEFGRVLGEAAAMLGPQLRVSDLAVRQAVGQGASAEDAAVAAQAMRRLLQAGAVRPVGPEASVAIFAAVLSRLQGAVDEASLAASVAIAEAVADEIAAAGTDAGALARLFAEFRDHV